MKAVLTGDIVDSSVGEINDWMPHLKSVLNHYGKEPKDWEIFRGDSFQLLVKSDKAIVAAIHLKAAIKQSKLHDVRIGIGIGNQEYEADKITESNGNAFVNSGESFDELKKYSLRFQSNKSSFDEMINVMLQMALLTIDNWTSVVSKVIKTAIENPEYNQKQLANLLNRSQSNISEAFARGGYDEIMNMNDFYQKRISTL